MPNFAGLWCPNRLTHRDSWGIIGKIISIAFIWYLVILFVPASLVTIASWKSGLILSSLKILISVLSNKAVLDRCQFFHKCGTWCPKVKLPKNAATSGQDSIVDLIPVLSASTPHVSFSTSHHIGYRESVGEAVIRMTTFKYCPQHKKFGRGM